jgi:AbiV family abortive infection protein
VKKKTKQLPRRYATAFRLGQHIYYNAARLFCDACTLYRANAFPSAYALAILGYEEIGKLQMFDHVVSEAVLNEGTYRLDEEWMEHLFSRTMFYSHRNKQDWGAYLGKIKGRKPRVEHLIDSGALDRHKQGAIYVGFTSGRTLLPERFGASHAYRQLKYLFGAIERVADLPFCAVFENSTRSTRHYAENTVNDLRREFSELQHPRRR